MKQASIATILALLLVAVVYAWWPWKNSVRAYNKSGQYLFSIRLDSRDGEPAITRCRAALQAIGGGLCRIPPNSLRLKNRSIIGADYPDAKIALGN